MARNLARQWLTFSKLTFICETKVLFHRRFLSTSSVCYLDTHTQHNKNKLNQLMTMDECFNREKRNKETFLEMIELFENKKRKVGIVEFIYVALKRMKDYGVHEDMEVYKKLIDLLPKGKMVATNWYLADTMYYPKHQNCITDLLLQMEENRIIPDREIYQLLIKIFGKESKPTKRYLRMIYWMPKFKYASPWPNPEPRPKDIIEATKLALQRMASVDLESEVTQFQTKDDELTTEDTWILSSFSPAQQKLIKYHPVNLPMYVEGPFRMFLGRKDVVHYFILRADLPKNRRRRELQHPDIVKNLKIPFFDPPTPNDMIPKFTVHEQKDGIIYGMCSTGTLSRNSVLSWIRLLQKNGNSNLKNIPILFKGGSPLGQVVEGCELLESSDEVPMTDH